MAVENLELIEVSLEVGKRTSFMERAALNPDNNKRYILITPNGREFIHALTPDTMFTIRKENGQYVYVLRKLKPCSTMTGDEKTVRMIQGYDTSILEEIL